MTEPKSSLCIPSTAAPTATLATEASTATVATDLRASDSSTPCRPMPTAAVPTMATQAAATMATSTVATAVSNTTAPTVTNAATTAAPEADARAEIFYGFFRSGTHQEIRRWLQRLAASPLLDRHDLSLLALMLERYPADTQARQHLREDAHCSKALSSFLATVERNEARQHCPLDEDDVKQIRRLIHP